MRVIFINVVVIACILGAIELVIRAASPGITPLGTDADLISDSVFADLNGPSPGASGLSNGAYFQVDSNGFWEYGTADDEDTPTWLLIGDSATMGIGVNPRDTFAGQIARRLSGVFNVLNPSLIGYSSRHYLALVGHFATHVPGHPAPVSRITIFWCLNDAYSGDQIEEPGEGVRRFAEPLLARLRRHWFTYQWLKATITDRPQRYYQHDSGLYEGEALELAVSDLTAISDLCDRHGIDCEVILLPYEYQLREGEFEPQRKLVKRLEAVSLPISDPAPRLLERTDDASKLYLYGDGIHFSEAGHRLLADIIIESLADSHTAEAQR